MEHRVISSLQKKGVLIAIDLYLAEVLLPAKTPASCFIFLMIFSALSRSGHLCVRITETEIIPSLSYLTSDKEEYSFLEEHVRLGEKLLTSLLCQSLDSIEDMCKTPLCRFQEGIYFQKNWLLQKTFVFHVKRLMKKPPSVFQGVMMISPVLNKEQKIAVEQSLVSSVSLIIGGPGTGKSFTAVEILRTFVQGISLKQQKKVRIVLTAPTGKAAALLEKNIIQKLGVLPEGVSVHIGTLHSFLPRGSEQTLIADLLLVDEASMLDAKIFVRLLSSLRAGGRLIFMGDKDQLPPVEVGSLFSDLITLAPLISLPVTQLCCSLRMETTTLQSLAEIVLAGDSDSLLKREEMHIFSSNAIQEWKELIWQECFAFFSSFGKDPCQEMLKLEQFRILNCIRKGPLGVDTLNYEILSRFLSQIGPEELFLCPILITANDPSSHLMNGDSGLLLAKGSSYKQKRYTAQDKAYFTSKERGQELRVIQAYYLPSFEPAYCLSVHKSQGSEYDSVTLLLPPGSERLGKEVLYTGVTRARKKVSILAEKDTVSSLLTKSTHKVSGISYFRFYF